MSTNYQPHPERYAAMPHLRCGRAGLKLPRLALGLWQNFGGVDTLENQRALLRAAFDRGISHFDLANNYGPPAGSAEENFGRLLREDFGGGRRDELVISTKTGWTMWPGPHGERCSAKSMRASLDQSLARMGLDYVDIYYAHRWDDETPLEETMGALAQAVRSGKALYAGVSSYNAEQTRQAEAILRQLGVPLLISQPVYNLFNRNAEQLLPTLAELGIGCIPFSPLAQGLLTNRYLGGVPADSRAGRASVSLQAEGITPALLAKIEALNGVAAERGASLAQLAVLWLWRRPEVTTVLIGASKVGQIEDIHAALTQPPLAAEELSRIEAILAR